MTMKKIKKSIFTYLPIAKLFFDDLEQIDEILKESFSSYTLVLNDEYELESIEEVSLIKDKQDFNELRIGLVQPYFSLNITQYFTTIYINDEPICIGVVEKIKPIIRKRRKLLYYYSYFELIFSVTLSCFNYFLVTYHKDIYPDLIENVILGIIILWYLKIIFGYINTFVFGNRKKNIVFTTKKSNEQSNYFISNKEELITKFFFGAITTGIGIFIGNKVIPWVTSLLPGQ